MPEEYISQPSLPPQPSRTHAKIYALAFVCVALLVAAFVWDYSLPPAGFVVGTVIHVEKDASLSETAVALSDQHVIRSTILFRVAVRIVGGSVTAGDYLFTKPQNIWQVAYRLDHNEQGLTPVRVTFPEGITVGDMGDILKATIDSSSTFVFNEKEFLALASTSEGYLFPDTYLFLPNESPADIIGTLKSTFDGKIAGLAPQVTAFQSQTAVGDNGNQAYPRTSAHIVTMASILEKEATSTADRRIIAGILWKRLDAGQALQVDAPFLYILGKTSAELTIKDLATSSPYNTYVHTGLPPGPIGNPGLDALTDAVMPTATNYWYYVNDKKGAIHYAATYAEQEANEAKYVE